MLTRPAAFATFALLAQACGLAAAAATDPATDPATRVEHDLLPEQWIVGKAPAPATLQAEMQRLHVPGVSIAVIHDGKIAWAKGYGVTTAGGAAITPGTLYQAASISKSVTAVAAMRMVQDGVLALDRPANDYLHTWKLPAPGGGDAVTVRQLLSHTAGLTVSGFPGYAPGTPVPTVLQVLDGVKPAVTEPVRVTAQPGSAWRYSGGGYTVLQQLMSDVDKQPFDQLMARRVLQPLGMRSSSFTQPAGPPILTHAALPHDGKGMPYPAGPQTHPELAAAGLWSTPSDLASMLIAVKQAASGTPGSLLTQQTAAAMLTPVLNGYALGFEMAGSGAATSFAHGGHNKGYQNTMVAYTQNGDGAVVMTNGDNGDELAGALVRAVAKQYRWPSYHPVERTQVALSADQARTLAGKYAIAGLGDFDITFEKGQLMFWQTSTTSEPLYAQSPTELFVLSHKLALTFDAPPQDGQAQAGRLVSGPFDVRFVRSTPAVK